VTVAFIKLNRRVALKMLTGRYGPDNLQRFLAAVETAAGLDGDFIARISRFKQISAVIAFGNLR
jgi:hypothetical protein